MANLHNKSHNNLQLIEDDIHLFEQHNNCITTSQPIAIHKFGGSSLANAKRLKNVVKIIKNKTDINDFIIVSANADITDWLIAFSNGEAKILDNIKKFYINLVNDVLVEADKFLNLFFEDIQKLENNSLTSAEILAFGEVWSARLLVELLNQQNIAALYVDARELLSTNAINHYKCFKQEYFNQGLHKATYGHFGKRLIITGFIATDYQNKTITLGRNGSDYSASLIAHLVNAKKLTLWTDVKGIFTADPNLIKNAQPIEQLSYSEAKALASVGTNVLHQKTISPLQDKKISLFVRSSLEAENHGTCISNHSINNDDSDTGKKVKSIAIKEGLVEINLKSKNNIKILLTDQLNSLGIFHLINRESKNQQDLTILVEESQLQNALNLFNQLNLNYSITQKKINLIGLIGNKIIYQKLFLQILQKILSVQFRFNILAHDLDDLFLIATNDNKSKQLLELIYLCCHSQCFFNDMQKSISNDYSLFGNKPVNKNSQLNEVIVKEVI